MEVVHSLNLWFEEELRDLDCDPTTRSYIVSILSQYRNTTGSLESFTLAFANARASGRFEQYQALGDWIFWLQAISPESIEPAQAGYISTLAQVSYATCHRLLNGKWPLYNEMAIRYFDLIDGVKLALRQR